MSTDLKQEKVKIRKMIEPREQFGFVLFFDLLGTSSFENEKLINVLKFFQKVKNKFPELLSYEQGRPIYSTDGVLKECNTIPFQDSLLITIEFDLKSLTDAFLSVGALSAWLIAYGLGQGLQLRGAISIGSFVTDQESALGKPVSEAVEWEGKANWCGVVLAPSASKYFEKFGQEQLGFLMDQLLGIGKQAECIFVKYNVPIKKEKPGNDGTNNYESKELWVSSWPLRKIARFGGLAQQELNKLLESHLDSDIAKMKWSNTNDFYTWVENELIRTLPSRWRSWYMTTPISK